MTDEQARNDTTKPTHKVPGLTRRNVLIGGALAGLAGVAGSLFTAASPAYAGPWGGYSNGQIPTSELKPVAGHYFRSDAADALSAMMAAFQQARGHSLRINSGYRDIAGQWDAWNTYGEGRAATPGTSNHGWAIAADFGGEVYNGPNTADHAWMRANAGTYGWWWAGQTFGYFEPWHWEYSGSYSGPSNPQGPTARPIMEISVANGAWKAQGVGHTMLTNEFSVVDMGRSNGDIFACEGGTLRHLEPTATGWVKHDSGFALNATSLSAVNVGQAWPQILAIENGQLYHVYADSAGWHKGPTGITASSGARISAVLLPGNNMQAAISDGGRLYHVTTSNGWQKWDTTAPCGPELKATYHSGSHPTVSTVMNGQVYQIYGAPSAWSAQPTGLQSTGRMTAINQGGGYPVVYANEGWNVVQTSVGGSGWERNGMYPNVVVTGRIDGITRPGYPILYAG